MSVKIYTNKKTCHKSLGDTDETIVKNIWFVTGTHFEIYFPNNF